MVPTLSRPAPAATAATPVIVYCDRLPLLHAVAARIEACRHGAPVVLGRGRGRLRGVGRIGRIVSGLADGPRVTLIAIVSRLLLALAILRIDEEAHGALPGRSSDRLSS